jgi:SAM-dependent methyltransferase
VRRAERQEGYAALAPFYDSVQGDRADAARYVRSLIEKHHPRAKTVLELACGTGSVLKELDPYYEVAGADLSSAMLELAARKLPEVRLFHEDMTRIGLGETFDVVLCVFDSINHLLRFEEWEAVFDRACEHLEPGGLFVFDVNTPAKLASFVVQRAWLSWFGDDNLLVIDVTDRGDGVSLWEIRIFERLGDASYRLHSEDIPEIAFPLDRIRASLNERFGRVWVYDEKRARPSTRSQRLHFVCRSRR